MAPQRTLNIDLKKEEDLFHPGFSIDCVILAFSNGELKVLMIQYKGFEFWKLPGSFVYKDEDVDTAAYRILQERTGLDNIFLRQFYLFGYKDRLRGWGNDDTHQQWRQPVFEELYGIKDPGSSWFGERYITIGYYALVDLANVKPVVTLTKNDHVEWKNIELKTTYFADHQFIINKALETIRTQLSILPIGKELLPEKFTMSELRILYETILERTLDRRNFQRKILSLGYIEKLNEHRKGVAHKAPTLYRFNENKYNEAQEKGLGVSW